MTGPRPVVAFLTDFGAGSEYVGALHALIARDCPDADRVDLAHDIPPGDVRGAALALARLVVLIPGAIVVAVVDPGVGTARRAAAVALDGGGALVGPDNGLLAPAAVALGARAAVALAPPPPAIPATFHGRDLFAPAAAPVSPGGRRWPSWGRRSRRPSSSPPPSAPDRRGRRPDRPPSRHRRLRQPGAPRARLGSRRGGLHEGRPDLRRGHRPPPPGHGGPGLRRRGPQGDAGPHRRARHGRPGGQRRQRRGTARRAPGSDGHLGALVARLRRRAIASASASSA